MTTPYDAIVEGIITRLTPPPANSGAVPPVPAPWYDVQAMPNQMTKWLTPVQRPVASVIYAESRFGQPERLGVITQTETAIFDVFVRALKLDGSNGAYALMGLIRALLIGYRVHPAGEQMYLQDQQRVGLDEKINEHVYVMRWACRIPVSEGQALPDPTNEVLGPPLVQATFNHIPYNG